MSGPLKTVKRIIALMAHWQFGFCFVSFDADYPGETEGSDSRAVKHSGDWLQAPIPLTPD